MIQFAPDLQKTGRGGHGGVDLLVVNDERAAEHEEALLEQPDERTVNESIDPAGQEPVFESSGSIVHRR